jgi:type I restriction enzyme, R subunit
LVATIFSQDDLIRRKAARGIRHSPLDIAIDPRIAGGGGRLYQIDCINTLCREIAAGRRKLLVEMATGAGKTRMAAALIKRLFAANWVTRALFVVDRNQLCIQAEDAFTEHLSHLRCYRVPRVGRRFQDEKRITIVTLQTLIGEYERYSALTAKTAATDRFTVFGSEIDWAALDQKDRAELEALFAEREFINVDPIVLERKFTIPERNRAMAREFRMVLENGYTGPNGVRRAPEWGKTIVFAVSKRHAETLARILDEVFADKKPSPSVRYADFVVSNSGPDDTVDAEAKIKRFKKEEFPQILVSVNMLDTGFDFAELRNLMMARFTHSTILYRQMRGRGTRLAPGKTRFTMFDFTGVTQRHGDEEIPAEGGPIVVTERKAETYRPRRLLTLDVHDEIDPNTREWVTIDETGRAFMDPDEALAEARMAAFEAWLGSRNFNSDQIRLLYLIKEQIKANGGDLTAFESWRFDRPPLSINGGFERARATFGGEEELERVLTDMNRAVFADAPARAPDADAKLSDPPPTDDANPSRH